jgi:hypothetical protein
MMAPIDPKHALEAAKQSGSYLKLLITLRDRLDKLDKAQSEALESIRQVNSEIIQVVTRLNSSLLDDPQIVATLVAVPPIVQQLLERVARLEDRLDRFTFVPARPPQSADHYAETHPALPAVLPNDRKRAKRPARAR